MKKTLLILICFTFYVSSKAQFSSDATMPLAICNAANTQKNIRAVEDDFSSAGGYFVYWIDYRDNAYISDIYGQRLDKDGNALWEDNGRLITSTDYTIYSMEVVKWQQGLLMSYIITNGFYDSVKCVYLDQNGQNIWTAPTLLASTNAMPPVLSVEGGGCFNIFPTSTGATITYYLIYFGGSSAIAYNKIDFNGNVVLPNNSSVYSLSGYDYRSISDGQDGLYLLSKGNGIGSTISIDKINADGSSAWPSLEITGGGGAMGFGGNISMSLAANNDLYVTWDGAYGQVYTTKILSTGGFAWPNARLSVSLTTAGVRCFAAVNSSDTLCITWIETQSGTTYAMLQKVGSAGGLSFPAGGKIIDVANGYYAYPKLAFDNDNTICFFSANTNTVALAAQSIKEDNSFNWLDTKILSDYPTKWNFYQDYVVLNSTSDCNAIFWTGIDANIYGASTCKIDDVMALQAGTLTVQNYDTRNKISWKTYNQIAGDMYEVQRSINGIDFTTLTTITANLNQSDYNFWDENPVSGINYYKVKLINADGRIEYTNIVSAKVKEFIMQMKAYPNPVKNIVQIMLNNLPAANAYLMIYNLDGKVVKNMKITTKTFSINMTGFAKGNYYLNYKDDSHSEQIKLFKD